MGKCQGAYCGAVLVVSTYLVVAVRQCEATLPDYGDKAHIGGLSQRQIRPRATVVTVRPHAGHTGPPGQRSQSR